MFQIKFYDVENSGGEATAFRFTRIIVNKHSILGYRESDWGIPRGSPQFPSCIFSYVQDAWWSREGYKYYRLGDDFIITVVEE